MKADEFLVYNLIILLNKAQEPAVVYILSFVAMLSLISTGTPCSAPFALPYEY